MPSGKGAARAFRIATAACKEKGITSFKPGTMGAQCRGHIAEAVARHRAAKKK